MRRPSLDSSLIVSGILTTLNFAPLRQVIQILVVQRREGSVHTCIESIILYFAAGSISNYVFCLIN